MNDSIVSESYLKYGQDGPFEDPVVRCDSCQKLLLVSKLKERGRCTCGMRKVRNVFSFTPEELEKMKEWGVDPDFLALFEETEDDG